MSSVNPFEALLAPEEEMLDTPEKQRALAAGLRRQHDLGTLFQLMGLPPTVQAGQALQKQSMGGLDLALNKQASAAESKRRAMERAQSQENWQRDFSADQAYRAAQIGIDRSRLDSNDPENERAQWVVGPDGRMYNKYTGEFKEEAPTTLPTTQGPGPRAIGFQATPPNLKLNDTQDKSKFYAQNMAMSFPRMIEYLQAGYKPTRTDIMAAGPRAEGVAGLVQRNVPRSWSSPEGREFYTEGRAVLASILRKESGAAITDTEWTDNGPIWLPWPGDSEQEIERKLERLESTMNMMAQGAGPAARYWQPPPIRKNEYGGYTVAPQSPGATGGGKIYRYDKEGNQLD